MTRFRKWFNGWFFRKYEPNEDISSGGWTRVFYGYYRSDYCRCPDCIIFCLMPFNWILWTLRAGRLHLCIKWRGRDYEERLRLRVMGEARDEIRPELHKNSNERRRLFNENELLKYKVGRRDSTIAELQSKLNMRKLRMDKLREQLAAQETP